MGVCLFWFFFPQFEGHNCSGLGGLGVLVLVFWFFIFTVGCSNTGTDCPVESLPLDIPKKPTRHSPGQPALGDPA